MFREFREFRELSSTVYIWGGECIRDVSSKNQGKKWTSLMSFRCRCLECFILKHSLTMMLEDVLNVLS